MIVDARQENYAHTEHFNLATSQLKLFSQIDEYFDYLSISTILYKKKVAKRLIN